MFKFKNSNFMGIQINNPPLSPRTERFFKDKGAQVTYTPDGYVALSNLNITQAEVDEFLKCHSEDVVKHSNPEPDNIRRTITRSTGTWAANGQTHKYPLKHTEIILEGDLAASEIALYAQKLGSDAPGLLQVGFKNIATGIVQLMHVEKKSQGEDFVLLKLTHHPKKIELIFGIIQTPPEYNKRVLPLFKISGQSIGIHNHFWLNCEENSPWIDPHHIADRPTISRQVSAEPVSKEYQETEASLDHGPSFYVIQ